MYRRSEDRPNLEPNNNLIVKGLPLFMEESQVGMIDRFFDQ